MAADVAVAMNDVDPDKPLTLMEKWRAHYNMRKQQPGIRHKMMAQRVMRFVMAVQAPSQLFMFHYYIIPYLFEDYDDWTRYYLKLFTTFCCLQVITNYLFSIFYNTSIPITKDRPHLPGVNDRWENPPDQFVSLLSANQNGNAVHVSGNPEEDGSGFQWTYCEKCKIHSPPRAHHCDICEACILKRDHHCFMIGNCIGFKNQRYFAVLTFYIVIVGIIGGGFQYKYLNLFYYPVSYSWTDFIPPVAIYRWLFGTVKELSLHIVIMIIQLYMEFLFGFIGFIYFTSQMTIIAQGKTLYELAKFIPIRNLNTVNHNFRSVFGDFWALNFIFPMQIIFRQREDGTKWEGIKVDHNANLQEKTN